MCFDTVDLMPGRVLCAAVIKGFLRDIFVGTGLSLTYIYQKFLFFLSVVSLTSCNQRCWMNMRSIDLSYCFLWLHIQYFVITGLLSIVTPILFCYFDS